MKASTDPRVWQQVTPPACFDGTEIPQCIWDDERAIGKKLEIMAERLRRGSLPRRDGFEMPALDWGMILDMHAEQRVFFLQEMLTKDQSNNYTERYLDSLSTFWSCCKWYIDIFRNANPYHLPDEHPESGVLRDLYDQAQKDLVDAERRKIRRHLLDEKEELRACMLAEVRMERFILTNDSPADNESGSKSKSWGQLSAESAHKSFTKACDKGLYSAHSILPGYATELLKAQKKGHGDRMLQILNSMPN